MIGMSCRFAKAHSVGEFWDNICKRKNCVVEVPPSRWDSGKYFDEDIKAAGKTYSKWGGFIDKIDTFDPLFFNISPFEAEIMDPQQRLFLEETWKAIESSGYSPRELNEMKCGVYVGVSPGDYSQALHDKNKNGTPQYLLGSSNSILAARIAYFLNLTGPSMAIDTACSSSLVAIHEACQSLREQECEMAIAGGISILSTPDMHIMASKAGMLSREGKCKTFDNDADGFVPADGVGVIILKPLDRAVADGDTIYSVIKGSGINQDGKTNGITAPSVISQKNLEESVYRKYNINPEDIGYVEAHGTGTKLGDPIEIEALDDAFSCFTKNKQFCAIGSVKTNIGHALAASGVASVIKTALCLKNKMLVPSINFKTENEHINFKDTPFYVNTELKKWEMYGEKPRMAAVSSFGFSGTNCHMVLQEMPENKHCMSNIKEEKSYIFPISAKTIEALKERAIELSQWLDENYNKYSTGNIAYTLSIGREHLHYRFACLAKDNLELKQKIQTFLSGMEAEDCFTNVLEDRSNKERQLKINTEVLTSEFAASYENDGEYKKKLYGLAQLYVDGSDPDWSTLFTGRKYSRIALPTYPFAEEHYWAITDGDETGYSELPARNVTRRTLILKGEEDYLTQHIQQRRMVLPGTVYLEQAFDAAREIIGTDANMLRNVVWQRPLVYKNDTIKLCTELYADSEGADFKIFSMDSNKCETIHSSGRVIFKNQRAPYRDNNKVDLVEVKKRLKSYKDGHECYKTFEAMGMNYGPSFRGLKHVYYNSDEALARIELPSNGNGEHVHSLNPILIDAALQLVVCFVGYDDSQGVPYMTFSVDEVERLAPLRNNIYAYARVCPEQNGANRRRNGFKIFDIVVTDEEGHHLLNFRNFTIKQASDDKLLYFKPTWEDTYPIEEVKCPDNISGTVLLFDVEEKLYLGLKKRMNKNGRVILVKPGIGFIREGESIFTVNPAYPEDLHKLLDSMEFGGTDPFVIIFKWTSANYTESVTGIAEAIENSLYPLHNLVQELIKQKYTSRINLLFIHPYTDEGIQPQYEAISGYLKTLHIENPNIAAKNICVSKNDALEIIVSKEIFMNTNMPSEILYYGGKRKVKAFQRINLGSGDFNIRYNGVYLITGGAGELGFALACYLAGKTRANIALVGRSQINEEIQRKLEKIKKLGSDVIYMSADISGQEQADLVVKQVKSVFAGINGVFHCAGVIKDEFVIKKDYHDMAAVLGSKVYGSIQMDKATANEKLDFFVLYSSLAGVLGNLGQCDYAYSNAFMDSFAILREKKVSKGLRFGKTLSINWPYWNDGGMQINSQALSGLKEKWGLSGINMEQGMRILASALNSPYTNLICAMGDEHKISKLFSTNQTQATNIVPAGASYTAAPQSVKELTEAFLKQIISEKLKINISRLNSNEPFETYGIDSVIILDITNELEKYFSNLTKTLFFEYSNIAELSEYFATVHGDTILKITGANMTTKQNMPTFPDSTIKQLESGERNSDFQDCEGFAIIGVAGRYPEAENMDEFWSNLVKGKDCISSTLPEWWDLDHLPKEKLYLRSGGFIKDADKFDPLFFNITPREAELMDPQERIFLETSWHTLEDAGYSKTSLKDSRVGVFVGVMYGQYQMFGAEEIANGNIIAPNSSYASVANRVSYSFNFTGPSLAVDTMCSSSLTAIHLACESIRSNECDMALAGGVNLTLHPHKYVQLCNEGFASSDGRCRSFGAGGDGYVPGEGVGAILIKPLKKAVSDGDSIYAVIKGTSLNHGGKTNGYTVPNPNAQQVLIERVLRKSNINPRTLSFLEAHGTGTALGDPIEITGLTKAFSQYTDDKSFCAIGSVKSNIGHCEAAAGIAAVSKVLLMLKNRQLVPSIHSEQLNPHINFSDTPFYVQRTQMPWNRPELIENGVSVKYPRRAGVSAFGAGGSNAHIIIEEYEQPGRTCANEGNENLLFVFSAKDHYRLVSYLERFVEYLDRLGNTDGNCLRDISYTLQVGREHMKCRLAVIASSKNELKNSLQDFLHNRSENENIRFNSNCKNVWKVQAVGFSASKALYSPLRFLQLPRNVQYWI
ncbi:MAG TPA: SDR family NAD(P)-dependent oxidoreductase [Ruminiclostridium sp.]|nr:SDR family NAD(P)-dependent oxidoreductase [Ruminiclostridium sp.]